MDTKFLEAWGNFMIAAAKGSESLEALSGWLNKGDKSSSLWSLPSAFCQLYGINASQKPKGSQDNTFLEIQKQFMKNYAEAITAIGAVPKSEYDALSEKYNALQQKNEEQARTIEKLQLLLATDQISTDKVWNGIQGLTTFQQQQARQAMDLITKLFKKSDSE